MSKMTLSWILAIIITLAAAYYQRVTGPTYPKKAKIILNDKEYKFKLPRTHNTGENCQVMLKTENPGLSGYLYFHRYKHDEAYDTAQFVWNKDKHAYFAELPFQPPAGKLQYFLEIQDGQNKVTIAKEKPIVIRFKGAVNPWVLVPHALLMFIAMLISTLTGFLVIFKHPKYKFYMWLTVILLFVGGMILGMIVQKQAFDAYWTGIPFGWDLTDNKLLIGFLVWLIAALGNIKKDRPWMALAASILLIFVYSIPHSMFGSELDYSSGKVITA